VDVGAQTVNEIGDVVSVQVIPRPHGDVDQILPKPPAGKK
jgi:ethanolamine utilization protein EutM